MEGMKFDQKKARWDLVPTEYFISMSQAIQSFIERHLLKADKIIFNKSYTYNIVRSNIFRWRMMGPAGLLGKSHPLMDAMIGLLMLAKPHEYSYEEVFSEFTFAQRWDLIDPEWTTKLAEIYAYGAQKYADNNWMLVGTERYYSALNRHIDKYTLGSIFDDESGFHHLYHSAWNCIALMWLEKQNPDTDIHSPIPEPILKAARKLHHIDAINVKVPKVKKKRKKS